MKVLVTGGAGAVGRFVVDELRQRGHEVTAAGRTPGVEVEGATYQVLDVTDPDAVREAVAGHDRVIHLAAVPSPRRGQDAELFRINTQGTFNVFEACASHGVDQVAVASSINALGNLFGVRRIPVRYLPIDEDHPPLVTDSYSFSKQVTERIGQYAWERYGLSSVSLRIPGVMAPLARRAEALRQALAEDRVERMSTDFWCLVDARDSARAFAAGVEAEYRGAHVLFINDEVNCYGLPSRELAARCYPAVVEWRAPMIADEALITCRRAERVIGWKPVYSWRGVAAGGPLPEEPKESGTGAAR